MAQRTLSHAHQKKLYSNPGRQKLTGRARAFSCIMQTYFYKIIKNGNIIFNF